MWFWESYKPVAKGEETISHCRGISCNTTHYPLVRIADGRRIRDPDDVAGLVAPDSRTLREAQRADRAAGRIKWWGLGLVAGLAGGFILSAHGNDVNDTTMIEVGLGIALGSIIIGSAGAYIEKTNVEEARATAWGWYAHDLADELHLCFNGVNVVPCEANASAPGAPAPPTPPPPRDPNLDQLRQK
jgi:hypothetical protein